MLEKSLDSPLSFLMELCKCARLCSPQVRHDLYESLNTDGIITLLYALSHEENNNKILEFIGEMLTSIIDVSPQLIKNLFFNSNLASSLLAHISASIINSENYGTIQELGKLIRMVLDPNTNSVSERSLEEFYKEIAPVFIDNINTINNIDSVAEILNIFTFCVEQHKERVSILLTMSDISINVLNVMKANKHLAIFALKFFKAVLKKNESSLNNLMIRAKVLDDVFRIFIANAEKETLLFSAVLSIFEEIKKSAMIVLQHVIKNFLPLLAAKGLQSHLDKILDAYNKQKLNEKL